MTTPAEAATPKSNTMLYGVIIGIIIIGGVAAFLLFGQGPPECTNTLTVNAVYYPDPQTPSQDFRFSPASPSQFQGCVKVTWNSNTGTITHTVTRDTNSPTAWNLDQPLTPTTPVTYTFRSPGTYTFHCTPHQQMVGTIIVVP